MTIAHDGFHRAIIESPEDDAPRLIYADWLDDHGDPARAEFIRLQIELASPGLDVDRGFALRRREKELLDAHGDGWREPFAAEHEPRFSRGFISSLALTGGELLESGAGHLDAAPVTRVSLRGGDVGGALAADLGACGFLRRLRWLDLYGSPLDDEEAARTLFGSPHMAGLRGLHLGEGDATPGMVALLAECRAGLRELYLWDFHSGALGDAGLAALAGHPAFAGLTNLDLLQTGVGAEGARAVAESPHLRRLESLSFGVQACGYAPNHLGPDGIRHLARSPLLGDLRHLGLGQTQAGSGGVRELARAAHLGRLKSLELGFNEIGGDGVAALVEAPWLASVTWLNLSTNPIGSGGVAALARSPRAAGIETLWLAGTGLGTEGIRALAESPHLGRLRSLGLGGNDLDAKAVGIMLGDNRFARLAQLHLGGGLFGARLGDTQRGQLKARFGDRLSI